MELNMRKRVRTFVGALGAALVLSAGAAEATSIVVNPTDVGWYGRVTGHDPSNTNFLAGKCCKQVHRNFFAFDLSGVTGHVTRAFLKIDAGTGTYLETAETTAFRLREYTGNQTALLDGTAGFDGYKGLRDRSATFYGSRNIATPGGEGDMPGVRVSLNRGLSNLNSNLGSMLILGGHVRGPGALWGFSTSSLNSIKLVLEFDGSTDTLVQTPLPPALALMASGLFGLGGLAVWRRRKQVSAS